MESISMLWLWWDDCEFESVKVWAKVCTVVSKYSGHNLIVKFSTLLLCCILSPHRNASGVNSSSVLQCRRLCISGGSSPPPLSNQADLSPGENPALPPVLWFPSLVKVAQTPKRFDYITSSSFQMAARQNTSTRLEVKTCLCFHLISQI